MSERYDVYEPAEGDPDLPWELGGTLGEPPPDAVPDGIVHGPAEGGWCVLVEFANKSQMIPPTIVRVLDDDLATREVALRIAHDRAFGFEPPDPYMPQHREVYEEASGYLTIVHGATRAFQFNTRVVRFVGAREE